jgi:hypothetical protein
MTSQPVLRPLGPLQSSCRPLSGRCGTVLGGEATILHRPRPLQGRLLPCGQCLLPVLSGPPAIGRRQLTLGAGDLPIDHPLLPAGQQRRIVGTQTAAGHLVTNHSSLVAGIGSLVAFPGSLLAVVTDPLTRGHYLSSSPLPTGVSSHALAGSSRGGQPSDNSGHARPARTQEGQAFPAANQRHPTYHQVPASLPRVVPGPINGGSRDPWLSMQLGSNASPTTDSGPRRP